MIYKLYATGSSSADGAAVVDVREDDVIEEVLISSSATGMSDGSFAGVEASFASTSGFASNDTNASFAGLRFAWESLTSGAGQTGNIVVCHPNIMVQQGERMYLHHLVLNCTVNTSIWIYTKGEAKRAATRRR
jgi:hypothetical protein